MIHFECPKCGAKVSALDQLAGRQALCKKCGVLIDVPLSAPAKPPAYPTVSPPLLHRRDETDLFEREGRWREERPVRVQLPFPVMLLVWMQLIGLILACVLWFLSFASVATR